MKRTMNLSAKKQLKTIKGFNQEILSPFIHMG